MKTKRKYEPTPEEIAKRTARLRAGWSDKTRRLRGGSKEKRDSDYVPTVGRFCKTPVGGFVIEMVEGMSVEVE